MATWKSVNVYVGTLVIGWPSVLALISLVMMATSQGLVGTVVYGLLPALLVTAPLALWLWYLNSRGYRRLWLVAAVVIAAGAFTSPLWFWGGPLLLVMVSEVLRVLTADRRGELEAPSSPVPPRQEVVIR